jgi:predicted Zn-dependent peptidase
VTSRVVAAILIASAIVSAQEKQKPPEGGPPKAFTLPAAEEFQLKNGARVTLAPYGAVPKISVRVVVRAGNVNEGPQQTWLADMMAALMKEGTATRTSEEIAKQAADMGGSVTTAAGLDETTVGGDALSERGDELIALVADVVQHPVFPGSELNRIRTDMLRKLAIDRSDPGNQADEEFAKTLYPNHPYGRFFPTEAMLQSYTIDDVRGFYKANIGAQRTHIYVAGKFQPSIRAAITKAFESWEKGPAIVTDVPKTTAAKSFELVDRPGAEQSVVRYGLPVPPPTSGDYIPLQVTDALLGGSFASRITSNIREQKGYTYSPGSAVIAHYHDAYWAETADITTAVTGPAIQEIVNEILRLRKEPPTPGELQGIKNYLAGIFVIRNSSRAGVIRQLRFVDLQGLGDDWLRNYVPNVLKVSPAEVQRITEKYLDPNKMALVVVGDKAKIADQLAQFQK